MVVVSLTGCSGADNVLEGTFSPGAGRTVLPETVSSAVVASAWNLDAMVGLSADAQGINLAGTKVVTQIGFQLFGDVTEGAAFKLGRATGPVMGLGNVTVRLREPSGADLGHWATIHPSGEDGTLTVTNVVDSPIIPRPSGASRETSFDFAGSARLENNDATAPESVTFKFSGHVERMIWN